jgi:flagellar biosynthesis/type III secretory pathway chaperone
MISSSSATELTAPVHSVGDLAQSIAAESAELDALLALLREEKRALLARDIDRVHMFAFEKNDRLARLSTFDSARGQFLLSNGLTRDHTGMQRYLARTPELPAMMSESWRRLIARAAEARLTNAVNGRLIVAQLRFVGGALAALQPAASQLTCYGADGQTRGASAARTLASA